MLHIFALKMGTRLLQHRSHPAQWLPCLIGVSLSRQSQFAERRTHHLGRGVGLELFGAITAPLGSRALGCLFRSRITGISSLQCMLSMSYANDSRPAWCAGTTRNTAVSRWMQHRHSPLHIHVLLPSVLETQSRGRAKEVARHLPAGLPEPSPSESKTNNLVRQVVMSAFPVIVRDISVHRRYAAHSVAHLCGCTLGSLLGCPTPFRCLLRGFCWGLYLLWTLRRLLHMVLLLCVSSRLLRLPLLSHRLSCRMEQPVKQLKHPPRAQACQKQQISKADGYSAGSTLLPSTEQDVLHLAER